MYLNLQEAEIREGKSLTEEARVIRLNKAISKTYEIVTMETFLKNLPQDKEIVRRYADRIIIIDEAHALRIQPPRKKKKRGLEAIVEDIVRKGWKQSLQSHPRNLANLQKRMKMLLYYMIKCTVFFISLMGGNYY